MPVDYSRLKASLANSQMQRQNNALYQTVLGLINGAEEFERTRSSGLIAGSGGGGGSSSSGSSYANLFLLMGS